MSDSDDEIAAALELSRDQEQPVRTYYGGEDAKCRARMAELLVNELEARAIRLTSTHTPGFVSPSRAIQTVKTNTPGFSSPSRAIQTVKTKTSYQKKRYELLPETPATKPNKKARVSNTSLDDDIAILLARGFTLRQAYEQLGLHQPHIYLPDENNERRHDALTSCDSSCTGTTTITSQSSFSTLTMSLDSADFYSSKPNTTVEYDGNRLGRRRSSHHQFRSQNELLSAQEADRFQELKDEIYRMQQVLGRPDRAKFVSDIDSDGEEDDDCEPALRPLLDRGYNLPLARKILCMQQQQRERKEGLLLCGIQPTRSQTTSSPCRLNLHAPQHHPVLQIDPRDLQCLLDMGFHPKAAAQALVRSQYDLPQAAEWLTGQNHGAE